MLNGEVIWQARDYSFMIKAIGIKLVKMTKIHCKLFVLTNVVDQTLIVSTSNDKLDRLVRKCTHVYRYKTMQPSRILVKWRKEKFMHWCTNLIWMNPFSTSGWVQPFFVARLFGYLINFSAFAQDQITDGIYSLTTRLMYRERLSPWNQTCYVLKNF